MSGIRWRWEEKDYGFRFQSGKGRNAQEFYQAAAPGSFYVVPPAQRKLEKKRLDELCGLFPEQKSPAIVVNPWNNYARSWEWIQTGDGLCLNYAGCLDREEINRREDEGVRRAMEFVENLLDKPDPAPLTLELIRQIHHELMGFIYPFAGGWRTVDLHKGDGPTKWPLPSCGIQPLMEEYEANVLSRSPFISDDDGALYDYVSEAMNEFIAIHPFREGNGRAAFIICNLLLMQNDLLPLNQYNRRRDEEAYYEACERGRIHKDYAPLAAFIRTWEEEAIESWETS